MLSNSMNRRHFLAHMAGGAAMAAGGLQFVSKLSAAAPTMRKQGKHVIVLYMGGGMTHLDTWTSKVGSPNQGSFEPIKTSADGIEIPESMPKMAEQFKYLTRIESYNSQEGDHNRGTIRANTGFPPSTLGVNIPHFGSIVSHYVGNPESPLQFISVGGTATRIGAGFLGNAYAPFTVQNPGTIPENIRPPQMGDNNQTMARANRRKDILGVLEGNFRTAVAPHLTKEADRKAYADAAQSHTELVGKALDVSLKAGSKMFEFGTEDNKLLAEYGNSGFGRGCLLARKLVESGVSAVEVDLGGWDMHGNIADGVRRNASGVLDPGYATLVKDLNQRGLLKDTLVVLLSDFGRTPRINQGAGRDHWGVGYTVVMGGAGLKQGVSYGATDKDGMSIKDKPVSVNQLFATMYTSLGIDLKDRNLDLHDNLGRRYYIAGDKENAEPIKELLA
jgi:uncharacterized protein (DUF1501 family)